MVVALMARVWLVVTGLTGVSEASPHTLEKGWQVVVLPLLERSWAGFSFGFDASAGEGG
jgi:hypothetical protein